MEKSLKTVSGYSQRLSVDGTPGKMLWDIYLTGEILNKIWKRKRPDMVQSGTWDSNYTKQFNKWKSYRIAKTSDGNYWLEWRSDFIFWASRWFQMPDVVGKRVEKIKELVESF